MICEHMSINNYKNFYEIIYSLRYNNQFYILEGAEQEAWEYMAVCVPIVVFFAPMGSLIASHFHRQGIDFPLNFHKIQSYNIC